MQKQFCQKIKPYPPDQIRSLDVVNRFSKKELITISCSVERNWKLQASSVFR